MEQRTQRQDDGVEFPTDQTPPALKDTGKRLASGGGNRAPAKTVNLALQGGGSHGAFAWGVLDRMLEDGRLDFEGISATSAGAMNAAVLAHGLEQGGAQGARKALAGFWRRVADAASAFALQPSPLDRFARNHRLDFSPVFLAFDFFVRLFSPYQFNPVNFNPLRSILEECIDFERLRNSSRIKLFLSATNVRTGKVRVFRNGEITVDAVLASACLPTVFHAVEIDGEAYWDGGYIGNPVIFPLIYECQSHDVVVVHLNPLTRPQVPKTAAEIVNRSNEICFNSSLMREMRAIDFITRLIDEGKITDASIKRMLIHSVDAEQAMPSLGVHSKLNADWEFLTHLMRRGRAKVADWLAANFQDLSVRSTADFSLYL